MKIIDVPSTGKYGLQVRMPGRYGQVVRAWVSPSNPRTTSQLRVRGAFTSQASRYAALTDPQQAAWSAAGATYQTKSSLGQSGPMTGFQLFIKLNSLLAQLGQEPIDEPTPRPTFGALAPQNLVITNTSDVIALKLTCPTAPGTNTLIRASAPQLGGTYATPSLRILGMCPTPAVGSSDITSLYVGKFGVPPVGKRVFVQAQLVTDGWEGPASVFQARVPVST